MFVELMTNVAISPISFYCIDQLDSARITELTENDDELYRHKLMNLENVVFGGGCFWCLDSVFKRVKGVKSSVCGYSAGETANPNYEAICSGDSGHAEVVRIEYDSDVISYETLLKILFTIHDPTTLNRQGNDSGTQYRSIILYQGDEKKRATQAFIESVKSMFSDPIVTQVEPLTKFFEAEAYHQDYFSNNPSNGYCQAVIPPKLIKASDYFID